MGEGDGYDGSTWLADKRSRRGGKAPPQRKETSHMAAQKRQAAESSGSSARRRQQRSKEATPDKMTGMLHRSLRNVDRSLRALAATEHTDKAPKTKRQPMTDTPIVADQATMKVSARVWPHRCSNRWGREALHVGAGGVRTIHTYIHIYI